MFIFLQKLIIFWLKYVNKHLDSWIYDHLAQ